MMAGAYALYINLHRINHNDRNNNNNNNIFN